MRIEFDGFNWDDANLQKCQKHGVSISQIQELFLTKRYITTFDAKHSVVEERHLAIGISRGRHILVVFTVRTEMHEILLRPISARYMHVKEIRKYEKAITKTQK